MTAFEAGAMLLGRYRLEKALAKGGMSVVHRGWDVERGRPVAIKVLAEHLNTDTLHRRFLREARLAAQVQHPNVVVTYDAGVVEQTPFLVMELLIGDTLHAILRDDGPMRVPRTRKIIVSVLRGVQAAHDGGVVHRDLKPSNVLITSSGEVKVIDFGLSKDLERLTPSTTLTKPQEALGTPSYMSPEQILADPVDARTDVYGVGVLAYELLTGERAFPAIEGPVEEVFRTILEDLPPPPSAVRPSLDPRVDRVVMKAMRKNPDERYQSADEMRLAMT